MLRVRYLSVIAIEVSILMDTLGWSLNIYEYYCIAINCHTDGTLYVFTEQ